MSFSGRLLLLFLLACAALWSTPVCSADQEGWRGEIPVRGLRADLPPAWTHREALEEATEPPLSDSPGQASAHGSNAVPPDADRAALARAGAAARHASDILLLIQRQNE